LNDIAAVIPDGLDHQLESWIDNRSRFLRIELFDQLHRALYISEQGRDGFALVDADVHRGWRLRLNWHGFDHRGGEYLRADGQRGAAIGAEF
jgi:hypothetical protein